jgi:hypothetical protein
MKILRDGQRGAAAAIVGAILVIILAAAVFWFASNRQPGGGSGSALEMAKLVPADSQAVWAWDLNGQVDFVGWAKDFKELQSQMPDQPQEDFKEFEKELGMSLEAWLGLYDGRGFLAIAPGDTPDQPGVIAAIGLADGAKYDAWWQEQSKGYEGSPKTQEIDGVTFLTIDDEPPYVGHDTNWLYLADSEASAKKLVAAVKGGGQNLDSLPKFQEGIKELGIKSSGSFAYIDTGSMIAQLKSAGLPDTDEKTFTELAAFEYVIGSADFSTTQWDGFTKVSGESDLAKQLLTPGGLNSKALGSISGKVTNANSLDLQWSINTILKLAMLPPESRGQAAMGGMALMSQGDPWAAFNGDITVASNALETVVSLMSENFGEARGQGQFTACKSNLKNLGTAMEMYSTDWYGKYPTNTGLLTPNYLKTIPECPSAGEDTYSASLKTGPDAPGNEETGFNDYYLFYCQGHHHPQTQENFPRYNGIVGLEVGDVTSSESPESEEEEPSTVVVATLKDPATTHSYLSGMMPLGGEPPKEGEEQEYALGVPMPGTSFKISNKGTPLAVFTYGPESQTLLDTSSGTLADVSAVKELFSWGSDGIVYIDYINFEPAYDELHKLLKKSDDSDAKFGLALMEKVRARVPRMDGGSCLVAKPNGLHYRALGLSNTSIVGVGAAILIPNFIRARGQGQTTACKSNLKNIGTGLEMYSTDWSGDYPTDMGMLTPNYLKTIPDCPAAGRNTYSESYSLKPTDGGWEAYYFYCSGENHIDVGLPANFPAYNGVEGLTERPW